MLEPNWMVLDNQRGQNRGLYIKQIEYLTRKSVLLQLYRHFVMETRQLYASRVSVKNPGSKSVNEFSLHFAGEIIRLHPQALKTLHLPPSFVLGYKQTRGGGAKFRVPVATPMHKLHGWSHFWTYYRSVGSAYILSGAWQTLCSTQLTPLRDGLPMINMKLYVSSYFLDQRNNLQETRSVKHMTSLNYSTEKYLQT